MIKHATLSPCGQYRYKLSRLWDHFKPWVCFVGLNPSTADDKVDDPTIRKMIRMTQLWGGYGGIIVVNLFAYRATDPAVIKRVSPTVGIIGPDNDNHIAHAFLQSELTVLCWGAHGDYMDRGKTVIDLLHWTAVKNEVPGDLHSFGLTKNYQPKHPLYLKDSTAPVMLSVPNLWSLDQITAAKKNLGPDQWVREYQNVIPPDESEVKR